MCDNTLIQLINENLSRFFYDDALFYAERLHSENPNSNSLNILAECYYRQGLYYF